MVASRLWYGACEWQDIPPASSTRFTNPGQKSAGDKDVTAIGFAAAACARYAGRARAVSRHKPDGSVYGDRGQLLHLHGLEPRRHARLAARELLAAHLLNLFPWRRVGLCWVSALAWRRLDSSAPPYISLSPAGSPMTARALCRMSSLSCREEQTKPTIITQAAVGSNARHCPDKPEAGL